ncbi:Protein pangolin, isoforms A/H/I/S [Nymphon striatum]|nr:Protein pangolin, isoforms A/H/I/S [Nymphon striatum]
MAAALISKIVVFKMSLKILNELEKNSKNQELLFDISSHSSESAGRVCATATAKTTTSAVCHITVPLPSPITKSHYQVQPSGTLQLMIHNVFFFFPHHQTPKNKFSFVKSTLHLIKMFNKIVHFSQILGLVRPPVYSMGAPPYHHQYTYLDPIWHSPLSLPPNILPWITSPSPSQHGSAYPSSIQSSPAILSNFPTFSSPASRAPPGYPGYQPLPHNAIVTPGPKQNISSLTTDSMTSERRSPINSATNKRALKSDHVKKPLNAFMIFMKAKRNDVMGEFSLKESAAINQLLGKKWHALTREEQSEYYEKAKQAREQHMILYPNWSARENYVAAGKKKRKKKDKNADGKTKVKGERWKIALVPKSAEPDLENYKKRIGVRLASKRKKKCTRYTDGLDYNDSEVGSVGESPTPTPESFGDSDNNQELNNLTSPSSVPTNIDSHPPSTITSRIVNGTLNPNDINHPLSVSQLTSQSHHHSSSVQSQNDSQSPLSSPLSLPSPISNCRASNSSTITNQIMALTFENDFGNMAIVSVLDEAHSGRLILGHFFDHCWLHVTNNTKNVGFQGANFWLVYQHKPVTSSSSKGKKLRGVKSHDLGDQWKDPFLEITLSPNFDFYKSMVAVAVWYVAPFC